jgi:hypothetical protein
MDSNVSRILKYYFYFCLSFLLLNVVFISVIAFFHFLLDHEMSIVENWIYRNNWEILFICKMLSFGLIYKTIELRMYSKNTISKFLRRGFRYPNHYIFVVIIFILTFVLGLGKLTYQDTHSRHTSYQMVAFFGSFFFYFIDYVLVFYLKSLFDINKRWERYFFIFSSCTLFFLSSLINIPYLKDSSYYLLFHMFILFYFTLPNSSNWLIGFFYIFFLISPLSTFVGIDPIWGNEYSVFMLKNPLSFVYVLTIWFIAIFYQYYIRGKRFID